MTRKVPLLLLAGLLGFALAAESAERVPVKVVNRQYGTRHLSQFVSGQTSSRSKEHLSCDQTISGMDCEGTGTTKDTSAPDRTFSADIQVARLTLRLPDQKLVVVSCDRKYAPRGDYMNQRDCRIPPMDDINVEFRGDNAKLFWPVSLDGKKLQSKPIRSSRQETPLTGSRFNYDEG